ncbi:MAG: nitronate monooxygenase [Puniceicoccales bacterium]|jgi:NAD(P)H-dependent flavin oxidoreductase YrpB (nitropropane dioxygenase family)|nr:nitronate monooxygenase [Puniceicoccales bacterium]
MKLPRIIQGGMGVAISNWRLARAVASKGELGVVSGTSIDSVHSRILQDGDQGGLLRGVYRKFPIPEIAQRVVDRWFSPTGRKPGAPYRPIPVFSDKPNRALDEMTALACFGEVELARGDNPKATIGINLLDKIRIPQLPSLYGAMLAGVDYVLMGAGIPRHVPGILDKFAEGEPASVKYDIDGGTEGECSFDPSAFLGRPAPKLRRPKFLAIITSATLAISLSKKSSGRVDGFVVETSVAGGHNAPPRGLLQLDANGEPIYGARDVPELDKIAAVGLPFWIGGGFASPKKLAEACAAGAAGIQVGTAFACCEESGMAPSLKKKLISLARAQAIRISTNPHASPTGFPFKVARVEGTLSEPKVYAARKRICDLGYLRSAYKRPDGTTGFRCASEPVADYVRKGGNEVDTVGRICLCNGLIATAGFAQLRKCEAVANVERKIGNAMESIEHAVEDVEQALESVVVTAGDSLADIVRYLKDGAEGYSALDVLQDLLSPVVESASAFVGNAVEKVSEVASEMVDAVSCSGETRATA